ncbi:MAG: hypothetical protein K2J10_06490, partial [Muribaculaceae bacterium]|nr:hypothetical protein [Muribaculaceae bacterium]
FFVWIVDVFKLPSDTIQITGVDSKAGKEESINSDRIRDFYGDEKIDEMQRKRDVVNYIILEPDQLDNDEIIDAFEKSPAFNRKKKAAANPVRPAAEPVRKVEPTISHETKPGTIEIEFSDDDFS